MHRFLPLVALFRLSLVFPDHAPSRFKVAMRTNTLRQLQRSLADGETLQGPEGFQGAAEKLVALASALNAHDRMTRGHTERVRAYTLMIGQELGLPQHDLDKLHWAGMVHDIGKLEVPPEILNKAGRPSEEEWQTLKRHPEAGIRLVEPLRDWLGDWADAASQHHERWDGKGYPYGLSGEQITLSGRIVAVADAYDVMTSVRSYKTAMTAAEARAELARCAGTQFDPAVVRAFLNIAVGRLRLVMGPLSWLAQAPALGNVPIGSALGTGLSTAVSVGIVAISGITGGSAPDRAPAELAFAEPVHAIPVRYTTPEDQPVTVDAGSKNGPRPTRWRIVTAPEHTTIDTTDGHTRLVPDADFHGTVRGRYEACWRDRCETAQLELDVTPVNDVPVANPDQATTTEDIPVTVDAAANDTDVEDARPTVASIDAVTSASATAPQVTLTSGAIVVVPPRDFSGPIVIDYTASDTEKATAAGTVTVEVTPVNDPPAAHHDTGVAVGGTTALINVLANDTDPDSDQLRIVATTGTPKGVVTTDGDHLRFTAPSLTTGTAYFTYTIEDPSGQPSVADVQVTIISGARQPVARDDAASLLEDSGAHFFAVAENDTDPDGALTGHTVRIVNGPGQGTAAVAAQHLVFEPAPNQNGPETIGYEICDPAGLCSSAALSLTIGAVNDPPTFQVPVNATVLEDAGPTTIAGWANQILPGPADEAAQTAQFTVTADRPSLFSLQPSVNPTGDLTFETAPNANGTATLTVAATDNGGTIDSGIDTSAPQVSTITLSPVNDAPVAVADTVTLAEDQSGGVTVDVVANDTDLDGDPVGVASFDTSTLVGGTITDLGGGQLNYTPDPDFNGTDSFTYTVTDGHGGTSNTTVRFDVTAVPDPPVASDDAYATAQNTAVTRVAAGLLLNDFDVDGDPLSVDTTPLTVPANGTIALNANGSFTYTPDPGFVGTDTFMYAADDGTGRSNTATVSIVVDSGTTTTGIYLDTTNTFGSWTMTTVPGPAATPEPDHDTDGDPGFTLKKSDGKESTTEAPKNLYWYRNTGGQALSLNGPVTLDLWSTVKDFKTREKAQPTVYLYDCDTFGLFCTKLAETTQLTDPYNGGIADWANHSLSLGNVTHVVPAGRQLRVRVQVEKHDLWIAASGTRPSQLHLTLANTAPVANPDNPPAILEDATATNLDVLANDTDTNLDPTTVTITTPPAAGTATPQPDGTIDYTPDPNANGPDPFTYQVCDSSGLCDTATVNTTVTAVNDRPLFTPGADVTVVATDPPYSSPWGTGISAGPPDETTQTLTFTVTASDPTLFSVQPAIAPDGTLTFTLAGTTGLANINVDLTDNGGTANGANNTAINRTFQITVNP